MPKINDLSGKRFGKLLVIKKVASESRDTRYECLCDCGKIVTRGRTALVSGQTESCGCARAEKRKKDLTGKRFGKLVAIERVEPSGDWKCKCDCGNETIVSVSHLTTGHTKSCGCLREGHDIKRLKDIKGQRFGRLVALEHVGYAERGQAIWKFRCDCGNVFEAVSYPIVHGSVVSCGCYNRDKTKERNFKHGCAERHNKERLYEVWCAMKKRCNNKNDNAYQYYGGRGVKVCAEWETYENFRKWSIENGYDETADRGECTIDRIDVNGNYEPGNCRWISMDDQMRNMRKNVFLTYGDKTMTVSQWARECGIKPGTLHNRLKRGWSVEDALSVKPVEGRNQFWKKK